MRSSSSIFASGWYGRTAWRCDGCPRVKRLDWFFVDIPSGSGHDAPLVMSLLLFRLPLVPPDMSALHTLLLLLAVSFSLPGAASGDKVEIREFATDGCSRFPDHSLISNHDWCHCCVAHDLAYWRGGTAEERLAADEALRGCVETTTRNRALADVMFAGVRAGGGPYFYTSYRWGYGWKYGRNYRPLSPAEHAVADAMQVGYLAKNPGLSCSPEQPDSGVESGR